MILGDHSGGGSGGEKKTLEQIIKERLNKALHERLAEIETKKEKAIALDKKIAKLPDGAEKRKLLYQKQQQENFNRRNKKSPVDEERALHESYQILLGVTNSN